MRSRETELLVLELLRAIRDKANALSDDFAEVKHRLDMLALGFGGLNERAGGIGARLDLLDTRLAKIERRLGATR